jgi:benzoate/toluate 1,2-dioxygenase alpha subunit
MIDISSYIDDRPDAGVFRLKGSVFTDRELFDLELEHVFERTWSFLAHESQLPKANHYVATHIGRVPVLVIRDNDGRVNVFLNTCRHKGLLLTRAETGVCKYIVCPYHGWAYRTDGKNASVKDRDTGAYGAGFDCENQDLLPLARVEIYRGLIFGSLSADVPALQEFLGDTRYFIDLAMDQGDRGMEFVPGRVASVYEANWKLQMDNGVDAYHLTSTHAGFMDVMARRRAGEGNVEARQFDWQKRNSQQTGNFQFSNGHCVTWLAQSEVEKRPIFPRIDEIRARVGALRAEWMLKGRNVSIFPNLQIADMTSLLVRTVRPLAVDRTELRYWCLAPIGEPAAQRAWRLRQFEDFFNVSGLATPDDTVLYEDAQSGLAAAGDQWLQGYMRGIASLTEGADAVASALGIHPRHSVSGHFPLQAETPMHPLYREWARLLKAGVAGEAVYA